jgi:hypothetical protein
MKLTTHSRARSENLNEHVLGQRWPSAELRRELPEEAGALREQVDWEFLRAAVGETPFGASVLTLVERLGIAPSEVPQF